MNRNEQQNAHNEDAGEEGLLNSKGVRNSGHGSQKASNDAQGGRAAK